MYFFQNIKYISIFWTDWYFSYFPLWCLFLSTFLSESTFFLLSTFPMPYFSDSPRSGEDVSSKVMFPRFRWNCMRRTLTRNVFQN